MPRPKGAPNKITSEVKEKLQLLIDELIESLEINKLDGNISSWDVSKVTDLSYAFNNARSFNGDISKWNTANVTKMKAMFEGYSQTFNGDISKWNTSAVTDMERMFNNNKAFNQNLSGWCVSNILSEPNNFSTNSSLSNTNKPIWGNCPK